MSRFSTVLVLSLISACQPTYPKCDKDEHCKKGEFCVNGLCQQCRTTKDCPKATVCKKGRCEAAKDFCETSDDCPNGGACKDNRCVLCKSDADCGPGFRCSKGKCLKPGQCATDADCPVNHECQNGRCVAPPAPATGAKCTPETVYFDFDEFVLTSDATARLQAAATCIKSVPSRAIRIEGHCDPRGTDEYNVALGDRRAQSVKRYLERLGVEASRMRPVSKGKLEATGTTADGWAKDRKAVFVWE
jgi:peptidoglycan-associated lipoprotein